MIRIFSIGCGDEIMCRRRRFIRIAIAVVVAMLAVRRRVALVRQRQFGLGSRERRSVRLRQGNQGPVRRTPQGRRLG